VTIDEETAASGDPMSVQEAAPLLGLSAPTVYRRVAELGLEPVATKPKRVYAREDLLLIQRKRMSATSAKDASTGPEGPTIPKPIPERSPEPGVERDRLVRLLRLENQQLREVIADLRMSLREAEAEKSSTAQTTTRRVGSLIDSIERLTRSSPLDEEAFD
jgi:DNA-binding Lrp family transcriptional regulator